MISVLLVDDDQLNRQGLRMWLGRAPGVQVIGEANTIAEAISLTEALDPDVILIDLSQSPQGGITATAALRASGVRSAVVLLSLHDDKPMRTQAQNAGAAAFVGKLEGVHALLKAIRQAKPSERAR
jgi:two-component system nitrate/nitrite response regulator NarL